MKEIIQLLEKILKMQSFQKEIFNMDDFCAYTGLSKHSAYHLTATNKIKFYRSMGKLIFFEAEDVKNFLRQNPVEPQATIDRLSDKLA